MKKRQMLVIAGLSFVLSACSSISEQQPVDVIKNKPATPASPITPPSCPPTKKNPINVSLYPLGIKPEHPYKVLGQGSVSKYNHVGIKRQIANIHDKLRDMAASMGGDAIINLKYDKKIVTGTIVTYDQNLA